MSKMGERIRQARKAANLSQEQLAKAIGVSQVAISQLETGATKETTLLVRIAHETSTRAAWLETGKGEMFEERLGADLADYDFILAHRVKHAAGSGAHGQLDLDIDSVKDRLAFKRSYLRQRRLSTKNLEIGVVDGLSMMRKYEPGNTFIYDISQREILNEKVYALAAPGMPRIKRLFRHGKMIEISSDNKSLNKDGTPEFPSEFVPEDEAKRIIIGRVVWHCGDD